MGETVSLPRGRETLPKVFSVVCDDCGVVFYEFILERRVRNDVEGLLASYFAPSVFFSIHVYALSVIILDSIIIMMFSCMLRCSAILNEEKIGRHNSLRKVSIIIYIFCAWTVNFSGCAVCNLPVTVCCATSNR